MHELVLFESRDGAVTMQVQTDRETVWLNRAQLAELFGRDVKTIGKHIANALKEELDSSAVAKFATVQMEGQRNVERMVEYYNLDMVISIGYRVKSSRGVEFRRWANTVLRQFILEGYAVNQKRLKELGKVIQILRRNENALDVQQVLTVIEQYTTALDMLDDYDHGCLKRPKGQTATHILTYEECREVIDSMRFSETSDLFGKEKDDSFRGSIGNIYQSFGGQDIYPTMEEKAANLLYFLTKNHSFLDGNKRIAATLFLHFLNQNHVLFNNGEKLIEDHTLAALTILIAESRSEEKETMISVILNCMARA